MRKPVEVVKPGVIAVRMYETKPAPGAPPNPSEVYLVTYRYSNNDIIIKRFNSTYSTIVDIDYLYENFHLYHSEVEFILYENKA